MMLYADGLALYELGDWVDGPVRPLFGRVRHFEGPNIIECTDYQDVTDAPEPLLLPPPRED